MIRAHEFPWLKEFLLGLCDSPEDRPKMEEILETFRKLWVVAKASYQNPYPQSPRLAEALEAIRSKQT